MPADVSETPRAALRVGWLELFYDLVFVVVIAQLSGHLRGATDASAFAGTYFLLVIAWTAWFGCMTVTNLSQGLGQRDRIYVLCAMAGVAVMAVGLSPHADRPRVFAMGYAIARLALIPLWARHGRRAGEGASGLVAVGLLVSAGWIATCWVPPAARWWCWGLLMLVEGRAVLRYGRRGSGQRPQFDSGHVLERVGAFVLITFGEAVAQLIESVDEDPTRVAWTCAAVGFILLCSLFWMFYDMALGRMEDALEDRPERLWEVMGGGQFTVIAGIMALAAGLSGAVAASAQREEFPAAQRWLLAAGVALVSLGVYSLTIDASRVVAGNRGARRLAEWTELADRMRRGDEAGKVPAQLPPVPGSRLLGRLGNTAQCVALPLLVGFFGGGWPPWLMLLVLALGPASMSVGEWPGRRRTRPDSQRSRRSPGACV